MNRVRITGTVVSHVETRVVDDAGTVVAAYLLRLDDNDLIVTVALPAVVPWVETLPPGARLRVDGGLSWSEWWRTHVAATTMQRLDQEGRIREELGRREEERQLAVDALRARAEAAEEAK